MHVCMSESVMLCLLPAERQARNHLQRDKQSLFHWRSYVLHKRLAFPAVCVYPVDSVLRVVDKLGYGIEARVVHEHGVIHEHYICIFAAQASMIQITFMVIALIRKFTLKHD